MTSHHQQPLFYNYPMFPQQRKDAYQGDPSGSLMYYYQPYPYGFMPDYPSQDNDRKRQRRQTAGAFMQNLFTGGGHSGRKKQSTAQPRPVITVPPFGIGPVRDLNDNDVLSGRGGRINAHKGNVQFRELVMMRKKEYLSKTTKKLQKAHIAAAIVHHIRSMTPPGRFLKEEKDGSWWDIGDQKAIKKVGQALREDAQGVREPSEDKHSEDKKVSPKQMSKEKTSNKAAPTGSAGASTATPKDSKASGDALMACEKDVRCSTSGRGEAKENVSKTSISARKASSSSDHQKVFQPVVRQEIAPIAVAPVQHQFKGTGGRSGGISGAAVAAMTQEEGHFQVTPPSGDVAFGLPFHPPPHHVDMNRETSMLSGLSGPSALSGLSNISGLSDPISSLLTVNSATDGTGSNGCSQANSEQQLQQLRQQWASKTQTTLDSNMVSSATTGTRQRLMSTNSGSSMGRSNSQMDLSVGMDNASMADHSLLGGSSAEASAMPFATMQPVIPNGGGQRRGPTSVANMSINSASDSLPSVSNSIMSDLSESLVALDLAGPRGLLDQL